MTALSTSPFRSCHTHRTPKLATWDDTQLGRDIQRLLLMSTRYNGRIAQPILV